MGKMQNVVNASLMLVISTTALPKHCQCCRKLQRKEWGEFWQCFNSGNNLHGPCIDKILHVTHYDSSWNCIEIQVSTRSTIMNFRTCNVIKKSDKIKSSQTDEEGCLLQLHIMLNQVWILHGSANYPTIWASGILRFVANKWIWQNIF